MRAEQIVRAWKDEDYRLSLTEVERSLLPEHPAGIVELPDDMLDDVGGANSPLSPITLIPVTIITIELSCLIGCGSLANGGTCKVGTAGCCES